MSPIARFGIHAATALALPAAALWLGFHALEKRDHPAPLARMSDTEVARVARPDLDTSRPTVVVLLGADLTEITDALGPYEMFARAGRYNVVTGAPERQPTLLTGGVKILPHYSLAELDSALRTRADVVVIPNLPNADAAINRPVITWIRQQAAAGSLIHSWCKGAMALAETGLLDGQTATAHWGDIDALEKRYPRVTWLRGVRWVDRGQYVMSAGITSGIDASLRVLVRIAGDSVARRVAREIRYPNYHFALDPKVEQFTLKPADAVLVANAAFRFSRPRVGVGVYDGVGEFDLSNVYDAHSHTMAVRTSTVALHQGPVVTQHGLTFYPAAVLDSAANLDRLIVPGVSARDKGAVLLTAAHAAGHATDVIHADAPERFGLEPVIEDLARTADVPTARFALKRMEFRSSAVRFEGASFARAPLATLLALLTVGALAGAVVANRLHRAAR